MVLAALNQPETKRSRELGMAKSMSMALFAIFSSMKSEHKKSLQCLIGLPSSNKLHFIGSFSKKAILST
jgi:hypothetical protein